jgi:hypothetical protein
MNTGDFAMIRTRVCTSLHHVYTIPSNARRGSGGAGKNGARVTYELIGMANE